MLDGQDKETARCWSNFHASHSLCPCARSALALFGCQSVWVTADLSVDPPGVLNTTNSSEYLRLWDTQNWCFVSWSFPKHTHTHTRMHRLTLRHQDKEKDRQTIYHQHLPNHITTTLNSFITTHPESTLTIEAVSSMTYMTKGVSPIGCLPVIFSNTMATCLEGSGKTQMQNVLKTRLTSQWL